MKKNIIYAAIGFVALALAVYSIVWVMLAIFMVDPAIQGYTGQLFLPAGVAFVVTVAALYVLISRYFGQLINTLVGNIGKISSRLSLIQRGDYNVFVDYAQEDELTPMVDTINTLTQSMEETVRKLTNEKKKNDYILENMDSALLLVDRELTIQQCNSAFYKYFHTHDDLVEGRPVGEVISSQVFGKAVRAALEDQVASVFDLDLSGETGLVLSARVSPIAGDWQSWEDEKTTSVVAIFTDVTQTRKSEEMRSQFVANVSHELKTPITSIMGFSELLSSGLVKDPEKVVEHTGRIYEEAKRMDVLIADILRLSALEDQTAARGQLEQVNLQQLCEEMFHALDQEMQKKGVRHQLKGTATVLAEREDMTLLLRNLIENAIKYNVDGGTVTVRLVQDAYQSILTVSDTGIGIPPEHQARVFERFYRVDKGRSKREGGTGLGLSIVKHITAKYQGNINLTSKPGSGTTIRITLPVVENVTA